jgi:divalent metal cation (Fe/Co/Zn/Cd) transporter
MSEVFKDNKYFVHALNLEYVTIAWNIFEGITCVALGFIAGSVALVAYGLESSVEVFASSVVVWELKNNDEASKKREKFALKLIGYAYIVVSIYIFIDGSKSLIEGKHPGASQLGIFFIALTFVIMMLLGLTKKFVGNKLGSQTVLADAKFTLIDGLLSATVLVGLILNALFGWWWADQALALFLSGVAFREGIKSIV